MDSGLKLYLNKQYPGMSEFLEEDFEGAFEFELEAEENEAPRLTVYCVFVSKDTDAMMQMRRGRERGREKIRERERERGGNVVKRLR